MTASRRIEPRTLKGFRDYAPEIMIPRERLMDTARRVYRSFGFSPIDTPALEYLEILTGKGGDETDKQLYRFQDPGDRWVALRFDLTVPFARFAAQNIGALGTPFKRYHIAPVWRGENTQRGRFREFVQCDFDTIGCRSLASDVETALVIHDLLIAIGFEDFTIRINHRQVLNGLLQRVGLAEQTTPILRALDKLHKIGFEQVAAEMRTTAGATTAQAHEILKLSALSGTNDEILRSLEPIVAGSEIGQAGLERLSAVLASAKAVGVPESRLKLDVSIARGLDYYTGTIYETFLGALPGIGSVCSGGRYDNLAEVYTSQSLPGIGASLGLDRLLAAMEELGMIDRISTPAPIIVPYFVEGRLTDYLRLAQALRKVGFGVEVYPEAKKLGHQLKYADRRGFQVAIIIGEEEFVSGKCQIKDLTTGNTRAVSFLDNLDQVVATLTELIKP